MQVSQTLSRIDQVAIVPFMHKGEWAIHDVLPFLLDRTGPAHVTIATFNISEESLRAFFFLQEKGLITKLTFLLDTSIKRHKLELLLFAANITAEIYITSNHAKVMLVEGGEKQYGVVSSMNMNNPIRWEAGFVFSDRDNFDYFHTIIKKAMDESILFEWSLNN
jgi:hypothetical protein